MRELGCEALGSLPDASAVRPPQLDELVGAYPNYNEEEEERRYYRRKRLGVLKNVLAASAGGALTYGVYLGTWEGPRQPLGSGAPSQGSPFPRALPPRLPSTQPGKEKPSGPVGLASSFTSQGAALAAAAAARHVRGAGGCCAVSPGPSQACRAGVGRGLGAPGGSAVWEVRSWGPRDPRSAAGGRGGLDASH